jgi:hypothetical protein
MRLKTIFIVSAVYSITCFTSSCGTKQTESDNANENVKLVQKTVSNFSQDSAYAFIEKQLSFGFRVSGTPEHLKCANWLYQKLNSYTDTSYFQKGSATTYNKKQIPVYNIIGSFNPSAKKRILLASHWDSRPWADADDVNTDKPILAANDGASGVAVLLEIARNLSKNKPNVGIDIILFDAEDYGKSEFENSFCLGSQFWARNLHVPNYTAHFGILLDMVGGKNAQFMWEAGSNSWANFALVHTWAVASELGHGAYFVSTQIGEIVDDHKYVYEKTKIPMIDIIQYDPQNGFAPYWHTHDDNLGSIDKNTLFAVGHTLENVIFTPPPSMEY